MRKTIIAAILTALTVPAFTAMPAQARDNRRYERTDNGIRYWKDRDGRYRCKKNNGTTGLLVGGVAGALVGRTIDTRGDRTLGTLVGAGAGALLGREIERGGSSAKCR